MGVTFGEAIRVVTEPIVFDDFSDAPCREVGESLGEAI